MAPFRSFVSFSRWVFFFTFWVRSLSLSLSLSLPLLLFWPSNRPYFMRSGGCRHESGTALDAVVVIQSDGVQGNFSCGLFFFLLLGNRSAGRRWRGRRTMKGKRNRHLIKSKLRPTSKNFYFNLKAKGMFWWRKRKRNLVAGCNFFLNEKHFRLSKSLAGRAHRKWIDAAISWWFSFNSHPISIRATGQNKRAREKEPQLRMLIRDRKVAPFITAPALRWDSGRARNELAGQSL